MRRLHLIAIIALGLISVIVIAAGFMRNYAMDKVIQKLQPTLQTLSLKIDNYSAPISTPLCYQNIHISGDPQSSGEPQTQIHIRNVCLQKGLLSLLSDAITVSISTEAIEGNIAWETITQIQNKQTQQNSQNASKSQSKIHAAEMHIQNVHLKLGSKGKQIIWDAQNSSAALAHGIATLNSSAPLKVDIEKAPFAFNNIPTLQVNLHSSVSQKTAEVTINANPPVGIDATWNDKIFSAQISQFNAQIAKSQFAFMANNVNLTSQAIPAVTNAQIQTVKAILTPQSGKIPQIKTIHIVEPALTFNVHKMLNDPNVIANPIFKTLIEFWQQEAGAILGKAPKDSVRREDVKKQKPPVRKNPIPPQTLENIRNKFAQFQNKLKKLPTIDIQNGKINIVTQNAQFDVNEIALNTENIFKPENEIQNVNVLNDKKTEIDNQQNDKREKNANKIQPKGDLKKEKSKSNQDDQSSQIERLTQHEPIQFQLAFNVRNAEANINLNFDGNSPFPTAGLNIENLDADDFLRLINMPIPEKSDGLVSLHLNATISNENFGLNGDIQLKNFAFFHEKISPNLIQNINASAAIQTTYTFETDLMRIEPLTLTSGPVTATGYVQVANVRSNPIISFELGAENIPCHDLPKAIPTGFLPTITDLQMTGTTISPKLSGKIPWKSPLTSTLKESGFENRCVPTSVLPHMPELLNQSDYTFTTDYTYFTDTITVGPGTDTYVPLSQIPPYVKAAMYLTEDKRFFDHGPLRISFIERALRLNLNQRSYVYGGSTISQQLTKNLFLTRSKNLARKLEEAFIAWRMETVVPKSRIFELYLNVIEFGPDIYGIKQAAHFYFDKTPAELTPLEGAFLASLKVSPSKGARFYKFGFPKDGRWWNKRLKYILKVLAENGYIATADVIAAYDWIPEFFVPTQPDDERKIWLDNYTEYLRQKAREKKLQNEIDETDENPSQNMRTE